MGTQMVGLVDAYCKLWRQGSQYERLLALPRDRPPKPVSKPLKRMRRLTPDKAAELVARYLEGEEITALVTRFGIDRVSVYKALENAGVPRRKRCITAAQREQAVALYAEGLSVAKVAARLGCSYQGLYGVLKRAGVVMRDRSWRKPKG